MATRILFEPDSLGHWRSGASPSPAAPDYVPFSISSSPAGIFSDHDSILPARPSDISARIKISAKSFIKSPEQNKVGGRLGLLESASRGGRAPWRPAGLGTRRKKQDVFPGPGTQSKKGWTSETGPKRLEEVKTTEERPESGER